MPFCRKVSGKCFVDYFRFGTPCFLGQLMKLLLHFLFDNECCHYFASLRTHINSIMQGGFYRITLATSLPVRRYHFLQHHPPRCGRQQARRDDAQIRPDQTARLLLQRQQQHAPLAR